MGAIQAVGEFSGKIKEAAIVDSNFKDDDVAMQVMVKLETDDGQTATWYGTLSSSVVQSGGNAGKTWLEITKSTLEFLGVKDLQLKEISKCVGKEVSWAMKEKDGRYFASYIITGNKKLDDKEVERRLKLILDDSEVASEPSTGSVDEEPAKASDDDMSFLD